MGKAVQSAAVGERPAHEFLVVLVHKPLLDGIGAVDADRDRDRVTMGKLVAAHRLKPRRAPLRERHKSGAAPQLHAIGDSVAHGVEVTRLDGLGALCEAFHQSGVAHGGIAHRLAESGAPHAVKDGLRKSRVDDYRRRLAADGKRVLHRNAVNGGGIGKSGVDHSGRSRRHPEKLEPASHLRGRVAGDVEHSAAAERDHDVVRADPGVNERRRHEHRALKPIRLDLLAARHNNGARRERYIVFLEILADLEPKPLGALDDVRVRDKRDLGRVCAGDGLERVGERRVSFRKHIVYDFDRVLTFCLFSCHFRAVLQHVSL